MATVQNQAKPAASAKYDGLVEAQLARAQRRVRLLDAANACLTLAVLVLGYALVMSLADRWLDLSKLARVLAWVALAFGIVTYLAIAFARSFSKRVNPYYAALRLEQALPGSKNSVVNWLDLRDQDLPPAVHLALGQRAAKELRRADLDEAIDPRRTYWLGGAAAGLLAALFVALLALGPAEFLHRLKRVLAPWGGDAAAARTSLVLLDPKGGDATVPANRPVSFRVEAEGLPDPHRRDAVRLLFRARPSDPFQERPLERLTEKEWGTSLPDSQVPGDGFFYKVVGGDAETPEYRVTVRPAPLAEPVAVTYHYRPYLCKPDETKEKPTLVEGLRGTQVTLVARANRAVARGELELDLAGRKQRLPATVDPAAPDRLTFRFVLDQDGRQEVHKGGFRVWFTSVDQETNADPARYDVWVRRDEVPTARLTSPGEDTTLAADALLELRGVATDDVGVKDVRLQMQALAGDKKVPLAPQLYRPNKDFRFADGSYPRELDYADFVELAKVRDPDGKPFQLEPGMQLEYWLRATDNCDYPEPTQGQVGESEHFKVTITKPARDEDRSRKDRDQAAQRKKGHDDKQDQRLRNEEKSKDGKNGQPGPQDRSGEGQEGLDKVKDKIDQQAGKGKGEAAPEPKADGKDEGDAGPQPDKGEGKGNGSRQPQPDAGQDKGEGQADGPKDKGEGKEGGEPGADDKGKTKEQPQSGGDAGQGKGAGRPEQRPEQSQGKDGGEAGGGEQAAEGKGEGKAPESGSDKSLAKGPPKEGTAEGKGDPSPAKGEAKKGDQTGGQSSAKESGGSEGAAEAKAASPEKGDGSEVARGGTKGDGKGSSQETPKEIADLKKDLAGGDAKKREEAERKLEELSRNAEDPKVQEAAKRALADAKNAKDPTKQWEDVARSLEDLSRNAKDPEVREAARKALDEAKNKESDADKLREAARALQELSENAKDPQTRQAARKALDEARGQGQSDKGDKAATPAGNSGPPGNGARDGGPGEGATGSNKNSKGSRAAAPNAGPNPEQQRQAAELQLRKWKEVRQTLLDKAAAEKAGLTEEERADALPKVEKKIAGLEAELKQLRPLSDVGSDAEQGDPARAGAGSTTGQGQPPPGFRSKSDDYQRRLDELATRQEKKQP